MEKAGGTARPSHEKSHLPGDSPPASQAGLGQHSSLRPLWRALQSAAPPISLFRDLAGIPGACSAEWAGQVSGAAPPTSLSWDIAAIPGECSAEWAGQVSGAARLPPSLGT